MGGRGGKSGIGKKASTISNDFNINPKLKADIIDGFIDAVNQVQERFGRKVNIKNVDIVKTGDTKYEQGAFDPTTKTVKLERI